MNRFEQFTDSEVEIIADALTAYCYACLDGIETLKPLNALAAEASKEMYSRRDNAVKQS